MIILGTFSFSSTYIEKHLQENFPSYNAIIQGHCAAKFPDIILLKINDLHVKLLLLISIQECV